MSDDKHWSDRDQNAPGFNDKAGQLEAPEPSQQDQAPEVEEDHPKLGLHEGPKPPASVEQMVRTQVREEEAIRKAEQAVFAKIQNSEYNNTGNDDITSDDGIEDLGDEGI